MKPRYEISPVTIDGCEQYKLVDTVERRQIGMVDDLADAEHIVNRLNASHHPVLRNLMAVELADFRMKLEQKNGGPLTDDPQIALLLSDLCDFFHFNEGERAIVLGRDLIIFLCFFDDELTRVDAPQELIVIQE